MFGLIVAIAALYGAIIGSFLNVVIHRVPRGESVVRPPSACPTCGHRIRPRDNVPVLSWLILRGRCRDCGTPISWRYPAVELGTAVAFVLVAAWRAPVLIASPTPSRSWAEGAILLALLVFAAATIALALIDLAVFRLPNVIVLPTGAVVAVLLAVAAVIDGDLEPLARAGLGGVMLCAAYFILAVAVPGGMGMGDVKLAAVIGLMLGWFGWGALAVGALAAFLLGGVYAVGLLIARRARRGSGLPFGPWMLAGAWIGLVVGDDLARAYLGLFGIA